MKIAIIGQQDFGKSVLEALVARGVCFVRQKKKVRSPTQCVWPLKPVAYAHFSSRR
jgi:hypothetical protein